MKINIKHIIALFVITLITSEIQAQYGYGNGSYRGGRQRNTIPQAQSIPKEEKPKTAEQIVDEQMPSIVEALELNAFEEAIVSSTLKKYMQERIEIQILKLPNDKAREAYVSIAKRQDQELKAGLPADKYEAFLSLQATGLAKAKKEKRKEKRKKKKKSKE